jgi:iron(III) transport system ATP-binding protein
VQLGPLRFLTPRHPVASRCRQGGYPARGLAPRACRAESALGGPLVKQAYLGSFQELTIDTELGPVFVVSPQVERQWVLGEELGLALGEHGVTVVMA